MQLNSLVLVTKSPIVSTGRLDALRVLSSQTLTLLPVVLEDLTLC